MEMELKLNVKSKTCLDDKRQVDPTLASIFFEKQVGDLDQFKCKFSLEFVASVAKILTKEF